MRRRALCAITFVIALGCVNPRQPIRNYEDVNPAPAANLRTLPGGVVVRVERSKDLPNAYGGRDIYGGKVALGFSELRFLGMSVDGNVLFRSSEARVQSAESTMTRYGAGGPLPTLDQTRSEFAPEATDFVLDLKQSRQIEFYGYRISVRAVAAHELVYDLQALSDP